MKDHLSRFGWLYPVCFAAVAWPYALYRMQYPPELDPRTTAEFFGWVEREAARTVGASDPRPFMKLDAEARENGISLTSDPRIERIIDGFRAEGSALLAPDFEAVARVYNPIYEPWERAARSAVLYPSFAVFHQDAEPDPAAPPGLSASLWVPDFLLMQTRTKLRCAFARRAAAEMDWPRALAELDAAAHMGDGIRFYNTLGYLIAAACRALSYQTYADLLNADPPEEFERAALAALSDLRPSDPAFTRAVDLAEQSIFFRTLAEERRAGGKIGRASANIPKSFVANFMLLGAVNLATRSRDRLQDSRLAAWASRFRRLHRLEDEVDAFAVADSVQRQRPRWTALPAASAWLKRAARSEPSVLENLPMPPEARAGLDPVTLAMVFSSVSGLNELEAATRGRVAATQGRLTEAAFAARLHRREHGGWPADFGSLSAYLPARADSPTTSPLAAAVEGQSLALFEPYRLGRLPLDPPLRAAFWGKIFPWGVTDCFGGRDGELVVREDSAEFEKILALDWAQWPILPLALAEALAAMPNLAEGIEVSVKLKRTPGTPGGAEWQPLDPAYARRVTEESEDAQFATWVHVQRAPSNIPPDKRDSVKQGVYQKTTPVPAAVRLRGRLRAPADALVIWSPGPDGVDDGGRICYDPTNGTVSRGDLLVFPEGY